MQPSEKDYLPIIGGGIYNKTIFLILDGIFCLLMLGALLYALTKMHEAFRAPKYRHRRGDRLATLK